jgi:hypothetical protein
MRKNTGDRLVTTPSHVYAQSSYHCMCVLVTISTTITGIVFHCIVCFRRINYLVVKNHLHSSSGVREVVSSTIPTYKINYNMFLSTYQTYTGEYLLADDGASRFSISGPLNNLPQDP